MAKLERFDGGKGKLKPFLPPSKYQGLRDDDRFLYNEGSADPCCQFCGAPLDKESACINVAGCNGNLRQTIRPWLAMEEWRREVHDAEYYRALTDGRCLRWRPIATRPNDRFVIIGREMPGCDGPEWLMMRAMGNYDWIAGRPATHWCEDTLGTPHIVVPVPMGAMGLHIPD